MKRIIMTCIICSFSAFAMAGNQNKMGEKVFNKSCAVCHTNGVAQAPKAHDKAAWQKRLTTAIATVKKTTPKLNDKQQKIKAINLLVSHIKKGMGAMPAGGMCPKCTDQEYKAAIKFMISTKK